MKVDGRAIWDIEVRGSARGRARGVDCGTARTALLRTSRDNMIRMCRPG